MHNKIIFAILASSTLGGCKNAPKAGETIYTRYSTYTSISRSEHTTREDKKYFSEDARQIFQLKEDKFETMRDIYLFFHQPENVKEIGSHVEECVRDGKEYGGYVLNKDNKLTFVKSCRDAGTKENLQTTVYYPQFVWGGQVIATYHCHADQEDRTNLAGPSDVDLEQILTSENIAGIVITKLAGKKFNVDIFFGTKPPIVIDLGNYSY